MCENVKRSKTSASKIILKKMYVCQIARVDCISCTNALFSGVELHGSDEATLIFFPKRRRRDVTNITSTIDIAISMRNNQNLKKSLIH